MALSMTPYAKANSGLGLLTISYLAETSLVTGIMLGARTGLNDSANSYNIIRVYPSSVPYPETANNGGAIHSTPGWILSYNVASGSVIFNTSAPTNGKVILSGGTRTANAVSSGTASWFSVIGDSGIRPVLMISDSISTPGGNGILQLSTTQPTANQQVIASFNLTVS